jgi:hypothetical protein
MTNYAYYCTNADCTEYNVRKALNATEAPAIDTTIELRTEEEQDHQPRDTEQDYRRCQKCLSDLEREEATG